MSSLDRRGHNHIKWGRFCQTADITKHPAAPSHIPIWGWQSPRVRVARSSGQARGLAALNTRGIRTARGGRWHVSNVKNVIDRASRHCIL